MCAVIIKLLPVKLHKAQTSENFELNNDAFYWQTSNECSFNDSLFVIFSVYRSKLCVSDALFSLQLSRVTAVWGRRYTDDMQNPDFIQEKFKPSIHCLVIHRSFPTQFTSLCSVQVLFLFSDLCAVKWMNLRSALSSPLSLQFESNSLFSFYFPNLYKNTLKLVASLWLSVNSWRVVHSFETLCKVWKLKLFDMWGNRKCYEEDPCCPFMTITTH